MVSQNELDFGEKIQNVINKAPSKPNAHTKAILTQEQKTDEQKHQMRAQFGPKIFWMCAAYLVAVFAILWGSGMHRLEIPANVLITLLSTSTINVLGLLYVFIKYIFK